MSKPVYLIGDCHGKFWDIVTKVKALDLRNCYLICVGDFGVGFTSHALDIESCEQLNELFKERDIMFYSIRGNHDNPLFFHGASRLSMSNFELMEDYTEMDINGEHWLFVGGATSVDRIHRCVDVSYWNDEGFVFDAAKAKPCDVLVTHSCPTFVGPFNKDKIEYWCANDAALWGELQAERYAHDELFKLCTPWKSYHGHFHEHSSTNVNCCISRIIDELEIVEHHQ